MLIREFDAVMEQIIGSEIGRPIQRLVEMAAHVANASGAILTCRKDEMDWIFSSRGIPFTLDRAMPMLPETDKLFIDGPVVIPDVSRFPLLANHLLAHPPVDWNWAIIVPIHIAGVDKRIALTCGDPRSNLHRPPDLGERLRRLGEVIADEIELIAQIVGGERIASHVTEARTTFAMPSDIGTADTANGDVVSEFMMSTLIRQRRLLRRGDVNYHALTRWRSSLKPWQIAALRALKRNPPPALIDTVSNELARAAVDLHGRQTFRAVTAVACGSSGPDCFAAKLGEQTAQILDLPYMRVFADLPSGGLSHPRRNAHRAKMRVALPPTEATLLIDDVATSGRHIEEATLLIRQTAPTVLPVVWIAD